MILLLFLAAVIFDFVVIIDLFWLKSLLTISNQLEILILLATLAAFILYRDAIKVDFLLFRQNRKEWLKIFWKEWGEPLAIAVVLAFVIRTFLIGPYKIPTGSMEPTLMVGDRIFVDKLTYRFHPPKRGEIVVFKYPLDPKKDFVKRLIAFSGDAVEIRDGGIYINNSKLEEPDTIRRVYYHNKNDQSYGKEGQVFTVPPDSFFVLGDNSGHSSDSRYWGFVPKGNLIGRAVVIWWPPKRIGWAR